MSEASVIRRERTELSVGLFILAGLAIMGVLIWQFGKFSDRLQDRYIIYLLMPDASGVVEGSGVLYGGGKIGYVKDLTLLEDFSGVRLTLEIFDTYKIPAGSEFSIGTSGLMGDKYINVVPPSEREREEKGLEGNLAAGALVEAEGADVIADLQKQAQVISDKVDIVLTELDTAISEARTVVGNLTSISEKFDQRVLSDVNIENFSRSLERVSDTTENLASASKELGPLLEESKKTVAAAAEPFERADQMIADLEPSLSSLGPTMDDLRVAVDEIKDTANNANQTIDEIRKGNGVVGGLISDSQMRRDLESLLANLEAYGILGYKRGRAKDNAARERDPRNRADDSPAWFGDLGGSPDAEDEAEKEEERRGGIFSNWGSKRGEESDQEEERSKPRRPPGKPFGFGR